MKRVAVVFAAPGRVEVVQEQIAPPPPGHLLVQTRVSAISAGTERLALHGQLPVDGPLDETLPALAGKAASYPMRYGYAAVGSVIDAGEGVPREWIGRQLFGFVPHASAFVVPVAEAWVVPEGMTAETAVLLANMETAVNLVLDGAPRVGERLVLFGQGVVGLLTTSVLARFPLGALVVVDPVARRAALGRALGASAAAATGEQARAALGDGGADLSYELTGNPDVLNEAIAATGREGRVIVGSFYGRQRGAVDLGGTFHRGRLSIVSSQVSHIAPALSARWDRARRRDAAWDALGHVDAQRLITHRIPVERAADAFALLEAGPAEALQVVLTYQ